MRGTLSPLRHPHRVRTPPIVTQDMSSEPWGNRSKPPKIAIPADPRTTHDGGLVHLTSRAGSEWLLVLP
jgi:hypothetical protein